MGALAGGIIAAVVGTALAVGASVGLVASQGANGFPEQVPGAIVVYGNN